MKIKIFHYFYLVHSSSPMLHLHVFFLKREDRVKREIVMVKIVLLCSFIFSHVVSQPVEILGLFTMSNCSNDTEYQCTNAFINEERMRKFYSSYSKPIVWCSKDVQNNQMILFDNLLPFVLEDPPFTMNCRGNKTVLIRKQRQTFLFVFTYVSFELTRIASAIILPVTDIILISITDRLMYPSYYDNNPSAVYSYRASFGVEVHKNAFMKIKNDLNVSYIGILNFHSTDNTESTNDTQSTMPCKSKSGKSAFCLYTNARPDNCFKELKVNVKNTSQIQNALYLLSRDGFSFVVLDGASNSLQLFKKETQVSFEEMGDTFYLQYFTESKDTNVKRFNNIEFDKDGLDVLVNLPGSFGINSLLYYISNLKVLLLNSHSIWEGILPSQLVQEILKSKLPCPVVISLVPNYKCGEDFSLEMLSKVPVFYKQSLIKMLLKNPKIIPVMINFWKDRYYIDKVNYKQLMSQKLFNPKQALTRKPFCDLHTPLCQPGYELLHSFYKEPNWSNSYGENCQICRKENVSRKV